jgi:hypothetical protein
MNQTATHHQAHHHHHDGHQHQAKPPVAVAVAGSLNRTAFWATLHCLSGCAVGEILGMFIGTVLAFAFGYAFTMQPLLRAGMSLRQAARLALLADTASIAVMEVVDNLVMLAVPGAMDAPVSSVLFWGALAFALAVAAAAAFPINRWLISRGSGHAVVHAHHHH